MNIIFQEFTVKYYIKITFHRYKYLLKLNCINFQIQKTKSNTDMEHSFTKGAHVTAHAEKTGAKRVGYV